MAKQCFCLYCGEVTELFAHKAKLAAPLGRGYKYSFGCWECNAQGPTLPDKDKALNAWVNPPMPWETGTPHYFGEFLVTLRVMDNEPFRALAEWGPDGWELDRFEPEEPFRLEVEVLAYMEIPETYTIESTTKKGSADV